MKLLTRFGVTVTICYLLGFFYLLAWRWADLKGLKLNELGDFFAGAFGPLAFTWLVLGYFLQDHFVRQSIAQQQEATLHQLDALRQQHASLSLIQRQAKLSENLLTVHNQMAERALSPNFIFGGVTSSYPLKDGRCECSVRVTNAGAPVTGVGIFDGDLIRITEPHFPRPWESNKELTLKFTIATADERLAGLFRFTFLRQDGSHAEQAFRVVFIPQSPERLAEGHRHAITINPHVLASADTVAAAQL